MHWEKIDVDSYSKTFRENEGRLRVHETFSDPTGGSPYGSGHPYMLTIWGKNEEPLLKCEMRKEEEADKWNYEYYKAV